MVQRRQHAHSARLSEHLDIGVLRRQPGDLLVEFLYLRIDGLEHREDGLDRRLELLRYFVLVLAMKALRAAGRKPMAEALHQTARHVDELSPRSHQPVAHLRYRELCLRGRASVLHWSE
jgi:hypothetical protein